MGTEITIKENKYGYIHNGKVFLKGYFEYPDREIGVVRDSDEASLKYFENRFLIAIRKVEELEGFILLAQNKGSYLMKLVHLRTYLANFDGLGDYTYLYGKLDILEKQLREQIYTNRNKNLEIKQKLLEELGQEVLRTDWNEATIAIQELKLKWIKTGALSEDFEEDFEDKFNTLVKEFYENRKNFFKNKSNDLRNKIQQYKDIIYQAEGLKNETEMDQAFQQFRKLQQEWKTVGKIPHKKSVILWQKFKATNDHFFARYQIFKELKQEFPNMIATQIRDTMQNDLYAKMQELLKIDPQRATDEAKLLLVEWKRLTTVFKDLDRTVYNNFRNICDLIFETSYMLRVIKRKHPLFESKLQQEKLNIKIQIMNELIEKEEQDFETLENQYKKLYANAQHPRNKKNYMIMKELSQAQNGLRMQKRKVEVKKFILQGLEEKLQNL